MKSLFRHKTLGFLGLTLLILAYVAFQRSVRCLGSHENRIAKP